MQIRMMKLALGYMKEYAYNRLNRMAAEAGQENVITPEGAYRMYERFHKIEYRYYVDEKIPIFEVYAVIRIIVDGDLFAEFCQNTYYTERNL